MIRMKNVTAWTKRMEANAYAHTSLRIENLVLQNLIIFRTWFQDVCHKMRRHSFTHSFVVDVVVVGCSESHDLTCNSGMKKIQIRIIIYGTWSSANEHLCAHIRLSIYSHQSLQFSEFYGVHLFSELSALSLSQCEWMNEYNASTIQYNKYAN